MRKDIGRSALPLILLIVLATFTAGFAAKRAGDSVARRKARHFYLSGAVAEAKQNATAEAAELYKKAYEIDSTYEEAALEYGIRRFGMPTGELSKPEEKDRSRRIARKFIDRYPGDLFPVYMYAGMMESGEELEEAIAAAEKIRTHHPGNSDVLQFLSNLYLDVNDIEKATETWDAYAKIEGEDNEYFVRKAGMRIALRDTVGAINEAQKMVAKNPNDPSSLAFLARVQDYFAMSDSALLNFRRAEAMSPEGSGGAVKMQLADFYRMKGDSINYDIKTYETLMADDLDYEIKQEILGYYLQNLVSNDGDRSRGDHLFDALLQQYPHEPDLLSLAAKYSASKLDFHKALEQIDYAMDLDHANPKYLEQALTYSLFSDQYEKGDKYFKAALAQPTPPAEIAYTLAGTMAMMADKPERALEIYGMQLQKFYPGQKIGQPIDMEALRRTLKADNVNTLASLYQEIGDAYFKLDNYDLSFSNYENSLMLNPSNPLTLNNYAYFLVRDGKEIPQEKLDKADELSKSAIIYSPDNPTYLDTRAWVLFRRGEYKEAKDVQLKAIELMREDAEPEEQSEFYEHLGDILFMNHEPDAALDNWKKALQATPDDELLKKKVKHKTFFYE